MSDTFRHGGISLGHIYVFTENPGVTKFNIEMNGIKELEQLCRLFDDDMLYTDSMQPMTYGEFKEKILSKTKRIYLSANEYMSDKHA